MDKNYLYYDILEKFNVSRETFPILEEFISLILDENKKINLISVNSEANLRKRHIIDCAQIIDLIDKNDKELIDIRTWLDFFLSHQLFELLIIRCDPWKSGGIEKIIKQSSSIFLS